MSASDTAERPGELGCIDDPPSEGNDAPHIVSPEEQGWLTAKHIRRVSLMEFREEVTLRQSRPGATKPSTPLRGRGVESFHSVLQIEQRRILVFRQGGSASRLVAQLPLTDARGDPVRAKLCPPEAGFDLASVLLVEAAAGRVVELGFVNPEAAEGFCAVVRLRAEAAASLERRAIPAGRLSPPSPAGSKRRPASPAARRGSRKADTPPHSSHRVRAAGGGALVARPRQTAPTTSPPRPRHLTMGRTTVQPPPPPLQQATLLVQHPRDRRAAPISPGRPHHAKGHRTNIADGLRSTPQHHRAPHPATVSPPRLPPSPSPFAGSSVYPPAHDPSPSPPLIAFRSDVPGPPLSQSFPLTRPQSLEEPLPVGPPPPPPRPQPPLHTHSLHPHPADGVVPHQCEGTVLPPREDLGVGRGFDATNLRRGRAPEGRLSPKRTRPDGGFTPSSPPHPERPDLPFELLDALFAAKPDIQAVPGRWYHLQSPLEEIVQLCRSTETQFRDNEWRSTTVFENACRGTVSWRRLRDIFPSTPLLPPQGHRGAASEDDIDWGAGNGELGHWLLSVIAIVLQEFSAQGRDAQRTASPLDVGGAHFLLHPKEVNEWGAYTVGFFNGDSWVSVLVDDRVPCDSATGRCLLPTLPGPNGSLYLPLLLKASAKYFGADFSVLLSSALHRKPPPLHDSSVPQPHGALLSVLLANMTGGCVLMPALHHPRSLRFVPPWSSQTGTAQRSAALDDFCAGFWMAIRKMLSPVGAEVLVVASEERDALRGSGLQPSGVYRVLEAVEEELPDRSEPLRLVRLHSPYFADAWTGAW
eukprot:Hpha_TRINITY_DN16228_c0_g7::TRINITY_DN16228_c0_g7_i1::g.12805::m.12805